MSTISHEDRCRGAAGGNRQGAKYDYDWLVIATGCDIHPEEIDGMPDGWRKDIFDYYTLEGALALRQKTQIFQFRENCAQYRRNALQMSHRAAGICLHGRLVFHGKRCTR